MNKLRNIYTLGTSFTKGGGFEFYSYFRDKLINAYSNLGEELTQQNFSYPGQLQKLLGDNNKVINLAESGYGNERIYYETYKVINSKGFDKEKDVFLFEFSHLGRTQLFSRKINKPIILNWSQIFDPESKNNKVIRLEYNGMGYRYWEDKLKENIEIKQLELSSYQKFIEKTLLNHTNVKIFEDLIKNNIILFLSYLIKNNIKFWFTQPPLGIPVKYFDKLNWDGKLIDFEKESRGFMLDFALFSFKGTGTITSETDGYLIDGHTGFVGNKMIAIKIYNHFINLGLLDGDIINMDYNILNNIKDKIKKNVAFHKNKLI